MDTVGFVGQFLGIFINFFVQVFVWFGQILNAHSSGLYDLFWGVIVTFLVYRFWIKPALSRSGSSDNG